MVGLDALLRHSAQTPHNLFHLQRKLVRHSALEPRHDTAQAFRDTGISGICGILLDPRSRERNRNSCPRRIGRVLPPGHDMSVRTAKIRKVESPGPSGAYSEDVSGAQCHEPPCIRWP